MKYILAALIAYLLGNFSTGLVVSKLINNTDIRNYGSHSTGATNMLRTMGWLPSILTLAGDALKAVLAAWIGSMLAGNIGTCIAGVFAILGHVWPIVFGFKGGKGIATSLGFIIYTSPLTALTLFLIEIVIVALTNYVSVASITVAILYPIITAIFLHSNLPLVITSIIIGVLAVFSHRTNIKRLINHEENRLDFSKIREVSRKYTGRRNKK